MTPRCSRSMVAAALLAAASFAYADEAAKSLTPGHEQQLKGQIDQCAQRVLCSGSVEERVRWQEELCKKLLQAEDYDNALKAAAAIQATQGANAERRAAHHFMMAQIYSIRMEKSQNVTEAEAYRRNAIKVANDVVDQNYPASWGVNSEAKRLSAKLQDVRQLQAIRSDVDKNQSGGVAPDMVNIARRQSMAMEQSVRQSQPSGVRSLISRATGGWSGQSATTQEVSAPSRGSSEISRASRSRSRSAATPTQGYIGTTAGSYGTIGRGTTRATYAQSDRSGTLRTPVMIDATGVRSDSGQIASARR